MSRGLPGSLMLAALVLAAGQSHASRSSRAADVGATQPRALCGVDVEAVRAACRTPDPFLALAVSGGGAAGVDPSEIPAVIAFRHGGGSDRPIVLATRADVGDVYGLAYDPTRSCLYAAAHHRAGGSYGPAGPGGIYRIDLQSGDISVVVVVDVGPDVHALDDPAVDALAVGRTSLGDLDLAEGSSELYVTDLAADRLARIGLPSGELRERVPHGGDRASGAHTFGLAVRSGWIYQGVVDTIDAGEGLQATVFRSRPGVRDGHEVLRVGLDYTRTFRAVPWRAWSDGADAAAYDSAMVADVAFRLDGAPIVGLRDRLADMVPAGVWSRGTDAGPSVGDIVPSRLGTDALSWEAVRTPPWYQDSDDADLEVTFGALAALPGQDVVVSAGRGREAAAGEERLAAYWFSNDSGSVLRWRTVLDGSTVADGAASAALASGDIEVLCAPDGTLEPGFAATGTAEAQAAATVRASEAARIRSTEHAATQTAAGPVQEARHTAAAATAAVVGPVLTAEAPTALAASTLAAGTMTAAAPKLTAFAPTADALATRRARSTPVPEPTRTAAAAAYDRIQGTCGSHNPYLVTARFVPRLDGNGVPYSPYWLWSQPAVIAFNDTQPQDSGRHVVLASEPQVGAVYGVAQDLVRDQVYVGAYTKRLSAFGPLGAGGIYRIDLRTGAVEPWAMLDAGRDPHALRTAFDLAAASAVGRVGLGDLELAESGDQLFAVNLHDRLIYRLSVPDGRLLGVFPHGAAGLPWSDDAVPFALAVRGGWLYHGVVDVGREPPDEFGAVARPAAVYVYRSRPDGGETSEVARLALDHGRTPAWQTWRAEVPEDTTRPEPLLTDIEFRLDGDLVLGIRDRAGDARILTAGHGDMVLTMRVGSGGSGERFIPLTEPEVYLDNLRHTESAWGGLAALPWLDETVSTVIDPIEIYSGGAAWFDNVGGGAVRLEEVYAGANQTFGKASGLGDIEALCAALTPTPSPTPSATATRQRTRTPSPSASPSRTPGTTPTSTPGHYTIYLPLVDRERACIPKAAHSDVILVLDMSTSMYRRTQADRTKHEAALEAARSLVRLMALAPDESGGYDQLAVIGFNDVAWTEQPLTNDGPAVLAALQRLLDRIAEGTRLDLALDEAVRTAEGTERRGDNQPIVILLTDGLPNRVPTPAPAGTQAETVVRVAAAAKARGIRLFTVGLGEPDDVLRPLLETCASEPSMYYYAPDGEDLAAIYRAIAGRIVGCS